jgi:hypothetical protein
MRFSQAHAHNITDLLCGGSAWNSRTLLQHIGTEFRVGEFIFGGFRCIEYIKTTARILYLRCLILNIFMSNTQNYLRNNYKIHCRIKYKYFQIIKPSLCKDFSVKHT